MLGVLVASFVAELLVFGATAAPASGRWPYDSATEAVSRHLVLPGVLALGVSVGVVVALGWSRAAGLGGTAASAWGTVPLALLGAGCLVVVSSVASAAPGPAFLAVLLLGLFLLAAAEEVMFRGFLVHGLTGWLDGETAVYASSWLFSGAHLPSLIAADASPAAIAVTLVALFGLAVVLCRIRAETGSVWWATGVHTLWNFATILLVMFPFPSRGLTVPVGLVKLALIVWGLAMAVGLARRHGRRRAAAAARPAIPSPAAPLVASARG